MKQKELEQFIENCEELIGERSDLALKKVSKDSKYKEKYKKYSDLYEKLIKTTDKNNIENFAGTIHELNGIENNYMYLQGFVDGILLRENLVK